MVIGGIIVALLMIAFIVFSRLITTTVHEFGHAIPALAFTDELVEVYVGSYHDISKSICLQSGRLRAYFTFNVYGWDIGLCKHQKTVRTNHELLITLGGPFASLFFAIVLIGVARNWGLNDGHITLLAVFILSSIWDFIVNIYPRSTPIYLHDGSLAFNDGQQVVRLLMERKQPTAYFEALEDIRQEHYDKGIAKLQAIIQEDAQKSYLNDIILEALILKKDYSAALELVDDHYYGRTLNWEDYATVGTIYLGLKNYKEALRYYNDSVYHKHANPVVLNNRGFCLMQLGEFDLAFKDFDSAIHYHNTYSEAYLNRGMVKINMGYLEDGETDIRQGLAINEKQALAYLYLGQLYDKKQNFRVALENYEKAKSMGLEHHGLDFYIAEARRALNYDL